MPVRVGGVLLACVLLIPAVLGVAAAAASGSARGALAVLGFIVFFGGIILTLAWFKRQAAEQRQHDRQWGPRPRPPG